MSEILHTLNPTDAVWLSETFARNRARFGGWRMEGDGDGGSGDGDGDGGSGEQTFTQADVDKIIGKTRADERRKASEKFADYDDLKKKAEGAKSLEDRVAEIEQRAQASEDRALRAEIANAKGLTPNQAKRLIGTSREELEADADELLKDIGERESERKKRGNRVPDEGKTTTSKAGDDSMREFTRNLFDRADD